MAFRKGQSGNPKGRPRGKGNKVTGELRNMLNHFLNDNLEEVKNAFEKLSPRDKCRVFADLLPYVVPRLQNTELKTDLEKLTPEQIEELADQLMEKMK